MTHFHISHTIKILQAFIALLRPLNATMSMIGVILGYWTSGNSAGIHSLVLLCLACFFCVGFGNCINDIIDIEGDKINHPSRPLPQGRISKRQAQAYSVFLCCSSLLCGFSVSWKHGIGVVLPLALLFLYAYVFKATIFAGNIVISLLVSYTLLFSSIGTDKQSNLLLPCILAFLLNVCREIIKDIQDRQGDEQTHIKTTAQLPEPVIRYLLLILSLCISLVAFAPYTLHFFGLPYLITCTVIVYPLQFIWMSYLVKKTWQDKAPLISTIIKFEMLGGLAALVVDKGYMSLLSLLQ